MIEINGKYMLTKISKNMKTKKKEMIRKIRYTRNRGKERDEKERMKEGEREGVK